MGEGDVLPTTVPSPPLVFLPAGEMKCSGASRKTHQPLRGAETTKIFGRKKRHRSADLRISVWSTPEAQRVACGFGGGPYTPKDSSKNRKEPDKVRSTAGRASGRPFHWIRTNAQSVRSGRRADPFSSVSPPSSTHEIAQTLHGICPDQ